MRQRLRLTRDREQRGNHRAAINNLSSPCNSRAEIHRNRHDRRNDANEEYRHTKNALGSVEEER
jgi:hypothetical protein